MSDMSQKLHPVAFVFTSHLDITAFEKILVDIKNVYTITGGTPPFADPNYFIIDGDAAERAAIRSVFPQTSINMCYFHVQKNCKDKLRSNPEMQKRKYLYLSCSLY